MWQTSREATVLSTRPLFFESTGQIGIDSVINGGILVMGDNYDPDSRPPTENSEGSNIA
jgi:hypothetical protein